jgi:hypothetical protein
MTNAYWLGEVALSSCSGSSSMVDFAPPKFRGVGGNLSHRNSTRTVHKYNVFVLSVIFSAPCYMMRKAQLFSSAPYLSASQFHVVFQLVHPSNIGFYTRHTSLSIIPVATEKLYKFQPEFFICSCIRYFEKMRSAKMNWWHSSTARKHVHTRFKLLRNEIQTCLKIVKLLHEQSNHTTHDQIVCATAGVAKKLFDRMWHSSSSKVSVLGPFWINLCLCREPQNGLKSILFSDWIFHPRPDCQPKSVVVAVWIRELSVLSGHRLDHRPYWSDHDLL